VGGVNWMSAGPLPVYTDETDATAASTATAVRHGLGDDMVHLLFP
jgi:hypothetical protein